MLSIQLRMSCDLCGWIKPGSLSITQNDGSQEFKIESLPDGWQKHHSFDNKAYVIWCDVCVKKIAIEKESVV